MNPLNYQLIIRRNGKRIALVLPYVHSQAKHTLIQNISRHKRFLFETNPEGALFGKTEKILASLYQMSGEKFSPALIKRLLSYQSLLTDYYDKHSTIKGDQGAKFAREILSSLEHLVTPPQAGSNVSGSQNVPLPLTLSRANDNSESVIRNQVLDAPHTIPETVLFRVTLSLPSAKEIRLALANQGREARIGALEGIILRGIEVEGSSPFARIFERVFAARFTAQILSESTRHADVTDELFIKAAEQAVRETMETVNRPPAPALRADFVPRTQSEEVRQGKAASQGINTDTPEAMVISEEAAVPAITETEQPAKKRPPLITHQQPKLADTGKETTAIPQALSLEQTARESIGTVARPVEITDQPAVPPASEGIRTAAPAAVTTTKQPPAKAAEPAVRETTVISHALNVEQTAGENIEALARPVETIDRPAVPLASEGTRIGVPAVKAAEQAIRETTAIPQAISVEQTAGENIEAVARQVETIDRPAVPVASEGTRTAEAGTPAANTNTVQFSVERNAEGNIARIEIFGELSKPAVTRLTREMIATRPVEMIRHFAEAAVSAAQSNVNQTEKIITLVSSITAPARPVEAVQTKAVPVRVNGNGTVPEAKQAPVGAPAPAIQAAQEVLKIVLPALIATPVKQEDAIDRIIASAKTAAAPETAPQFSAEAKIEVIRNLATKFPQAALPILVETAASPPQAADKSIVKALETIALDIVRIPEVREYVARAVAQDAKSPLSVPSELSDKVIIQTARTLLSRKAQQPKKADRPSMENAKAESMNTLSGIANLVANANQIIPDRLTAEVARPFIALVNQIKESRQVIRDIKQRMQKEATSKDRRISRITIPNPFSRAKKRPILKLVNHKEIGRINKSLSALSKKARAAEEAGLKVPETAFRSLRAALASMGLIAPQPETAPGTFRTAVPKPASRRLHQFVQILEKELSRIQAIQEKAPSASVKISAIQAEIMTLAIIMRMVGGNLAEVEKILRKLSKKRFDEIAAALREGDEESREAALAELNEMVLIHDIEALRRSEELLAA
jgi:hypothetical protein